MGCLFFCTLFSLIRSSILFLCKTFAPCCCNITRFRLNSGEEADLPQIVYKCKEIREECRLTNPEILAKPAVSVFAASGPCSDFKQYDFLNSVNPYFDTILCGIFKVMFTNEVESENMYPKKVGRPRVHQSGGAIPGTAGVENLISVAGGGVSQIPPDMTD